MKKHILFFLFLFGCLVVKAQDLSYGLEINDLSLHPMQDIPRPAYLEAITDPAFKTTIRRISNAKSGAWNGVVPMYSTVQAWNADESRMILYDITAISHQLLDGKTYEFIRHLDDINPNRFRCIFWDFNDPDILYYLNDNLKEFIRYNVETLTQEILVDLSAISGCYEDLSLGNNIQMMSWDSDVIGFSCQTFSDYKYYSYRISTGTLTQFNTADSYATAEAPIPGPSGEYFYYNRRSYNSMGVLHTKLNEAHTEAGCLGQLGNGHDAYFNVSYSEFPESNCNGNLAAFDLETGHCFPIMSKAQGYKDSQKYTRISALAHKNTEGAWLCASIMGPLPQNGQGLLNQELVIIKAEEDNVKICRIGHHRALKNLDMPGPYSANIYNRYLGPHACISPTGTRVLFSSDWNGAKNGYTLDSYVVELPIYNLSREINLRVFLEGAIQRNGQMNDALNQNNLLPTTHPYTVVPYNHLKETTPIDLPAGTVDWVLVEARSGTPSNSTTRGTKMVETHVGLLGTDGYIRHPKTGGNLIFTQLNPEEKYHFVVRHRNHLDIISSVPLDGETLTYDFTIGEDQAFGSEQLKSYDANGQTYWTMYAGEFTQEGIVQTKDYYEWSVLPAILNEYLTTDANLDGIIQTTDYDLWFANKSKVGSIEVQ